MSHFTLYVGEVRQWRVTIMDRVTGLPVRLDTPAALSLEVVVISPLTGVAVLGLKSGDGIDHEEDQVAKPGQALVNISEALSSLIPPSDYRVLTWVSDGTTNPQVVAATRLKVLPARRASDVPAPAS